MADLKTLLRRGRRVRTLGVDDAPFRRGQRQDVLVVGAVCSGTRFEGLLTTKVRPDGFNATARLERLVAESKFSDQLHLILIDGITLGGFNVVDIRALHQSLDIPVAAVTRKAPDFEAIGRVLVRLSQPERRRRQMRRAGPVHRGVDVHFQVQGADPEIVAKVLASITDRGHIPEPLRVAHLIGRGVIKGESGHRA